MDEERIRIAAVLEQYKICPDYAIGREHKWSKESRSGFDKMLATGVKEIYTLKWLRSPALFGEVSRITG